MRAVVAFSNFPGKRLEGSCGILQKKGENEGSCGTFLSIGSDLSLLLLIPKQVSIEI